MSIISDESSTTPKTEAEIAAEVKAAEEFRRWITQVAVFSPFNPPPEAPKEKSTGYIF
ncbi:MAG: hypothetical protein AAB873_00160 [Patescibacteria group bacterium]